MGQEPTLDVDASIEIVKQTHGFVDLYKVGRVKLYADDENHGLEGLH